MDPRSGTHAVMIHARGRSERRRAPIAPLRAWTVVPPILAMGPVILSSAELERMRRQVRLPESLHADAGDARSRISRALPPPTPLGKECTHRR